MGVRFPPGSRNIRKSIEIDSEDPLNGVRYQGESWSCGPASVVNACRSFGIKLDERRIRSLAGTSIRGTDDFEMIAAIRALGLTASPSHTRDAKSAWAFLRSNLISGRPVILCINQWDHWVSAVGLIGNSIVLVDPARTVRNKAENGVSVLGRNKLLKRWRCKGEQIPFYGIAVGR